MKITLGKVEFEVDTIAEELRSAIVADPTLARARASVVWTWDREAGTGEARLPLANGGVPLPNGIAFYVPKKGEDGRLQKNVKPSQAMQARFLEAVGAQNLTQVLRGIQPLLHVAHKPLPLDHFAPLKPLTSFDIVLMTEHNVVALKEPSRNLTAYLFVPGQVFFRAVWPKEAPEAVTTAIEKPMPISMIPTYSKANHTIRMLALSRRVKDLQPLVDAMRRDEIPVNPAIVGTLAGVVAELRGLAQPQVRPAPARVQ